MKKKWFNCEGTFVLPKWLLAMKLTLMVFLIALLQVNASVYSQQTKLSLDIENSTVKEVLKSIEDQSEFLFMYNNEDVDVSRNVSINVENNSVEDILNDLFKSTDVSFEIINRQIVLKTQNNLFGTTQQVVSVSGIVSNEEGEPIPGVTVFVKGTTKGTITDMDGKYVISNIAVDSKLVFSFIGMTTQEVDIAGQSEIDVTMLADVIGIEEVVAIGYGVSKKSDLTGSVASVSGEDFENVPVSRVDQILQGKAAGVQVTQTNGAPGSGSSIRIRGGNSIQGNNEPLYVIDGFIVGTDFNLNNINVNDIESLEILKDATAISIYGTRGANGVILISTKSGLDVQPGKPIVRFNTYAGIQELTSTIDLASGPDLARLANLDAEKRNAALPFPDLSIVPDVDWIDQVTQTAPMYNVDLSISGRSEKGNVNYYISGNYFNQEGIVRASGIEKYTFRTNIDVKLSEKLSMGVRLNVSHNYRERNKVNLSSLWNDGLTAKAIYNEDGSFTDKNPVTDGTQRNAEADIQLRVDHQYQTNILGNAYLQFEPIKDLIFKTTIGPKVNYLKRNRYNPGILPERLIDNSGGYARINTAQDIDVLNENTVSYAKQINDDHKFDVLAGFTWQTSTLETTNAEAEGFTNDVLEYNNLEIGSDPTRNVVESGFTKFQLVSWLGRVNYNFKERYLLTFVGRVDGASRFAGSNNEYAFFPSGAIAWRMIEEPWVQDLGVFDNLKLRASFGRSGSQAIAPYRTLAVLDARSMFFNGLEQVGVRNGRPRSPDLMWETTEQLDIGLESAFLGGRLAVEIDYYQKKTSDLLLNVRIPPQTGFNDKLQNLGEVENKGLELLINTVNVKTRDFSWETSLTIAANRSNVLDIGDAEYIDIASPTNQGGPGGRLIVGETAPAFVGVQYLGVWNSQEEIDESGILNQMVGGPRFKDTDGDKVISINDFEVIGSPEADFFGGIQNTFKWKDLTLDVYFNGSYGNDLYNSLSHQAYFFREGSNAYADLVNHWSETNKDSDIPMPGTSQSLANIKSNTRLIEDGSYLRLKNVRLTYDVPTHKLAAINWINKLNVYVSGTNLALFSKNKLFDPEVSRYANGGSENESVQTGFTRGEYPYARTITFGLKAEF